MSRVLYEPADKIENEARTGNIVPICLSRAGLYSAVVLCQDPFSHWLWFIIR